MKLIAYVALFALPPFLSGCLSMKVTQAVDTHMVETRLYDSVDKIEKAGVTKDDQVWIFFEKDQTNSMPDRFTLVIPLAQIRTNVQNQPGFATAGILRTTNNYDLYQKLSPAAADFMFPESKLPADKTNALFVKCVITS